MKVATWNVSSIRSRAERVLAWTEREMPDVLCFQEIKTTDELFPRARFEELGYHVESSALVWWSPALCWWLSALVWWSPSPGW